MGKSDLMNTLIQYENIKDKNFDFALTNLINKVNPGINIDDFGSQIQRNKSADIFYEEKIRKKSETHIYQEFKKRIEDIPASNGTRLFNKLNYNIGVIGDSEIINLLNETARINYISKENLIDTNQIDILIVTTLNSGVDNTWRDLSRSSSTAQQELIKYINKIKSKHVPVVFLADEMNHDVNPYFNLMSMCDIIYTNNERSISLIKQKTDKKDVFLLENIINPLHYNPIGIDNDLSEINNTKVIYKDFWDATSINKQIEAKRMIESVIKSDIELNIYDEKYDSKDLTNQFPNEYLSTIYTPFNNININKLYKWSLVINKEKYQGAMISNKLFESMAMGNVVLSNYNSQVNNKIPSVKMIHEYNDINQIVSMDNKKYLNLRSKNIRYVMNNHNVFFALRSILRDLGFNETVRQPKVLVVLEQESEKNNQNYHRQLYNNKEYIYREDLKKFDISNYDFITFFHEKYIYEEYYLEDLVTGFHYTDCNFISKSNSDDTHSYISNISNPYVTMIDVKIYLKFKNYDEITLGYNLDNSELLNSEKIISSSRKTKKEVSIIVPIHNNGHYLEEKCFASLERSSSFSSMEIIFINDGSTDTLTKKVINRLRRRYPDIVYYEFDEGSGSASRPRNKGVELASTQYISYIDPDNEALGDGYHYLIKAITEEKVDAVIGNIITEYSNKRDASKYTTALKKFNNNQFFVENPKKLLINSGMKVQSIQAMIIKKSIIKNNKILMIEGAAGQDTMFFQEVILNCKSVLGVDSYIHVYYADVSGSVTNTLSKKFFDKYYILEQKRIPFLEKYNILKIYLKEVFNYYIRNWYFKKLDLVADEERSAAINRLLQIMSLYNEYREYLEPDNREMLTKLYVEDMTNSKVEKNFSGKELKIFNTAIENKTNENFEIRDIKLFKRMSEQLSMENILYTFYLDSKNYSDFENLDYNIFTNENFVVVIEKNILEKFNILRIIKKFYIKNVYSDDDTIIINLFKPTKFNNLMENNNINIIRKAYELTSENTDIIDLYTAKEGLDLSEKLLDEINSNLITKKKILKLMNQL